MQHIDCERPNGELLVTIEPGGQFATLTDDGTGLSYSFVLEDPEYLAETVSGETRWDYRPDLQPDDIGCDLESAGRYLTE